MERLRRVKNGAAWVIRRLKGAYPDAACSLRYRNAFELLVATILSAQCTDERVNLVTKELFRRCKNAESLDRIEREALEEIIRSTGFYRNKARSLKGMAGTLLQEHGGEVPCSMNELVALPGVARKTANVVLGNAFGLQEGVVVDTHVKRIAARIGWSREKNPDKIEKDLMVLLPRKDWTFMGHVLIQHGRSVCKARKPICGECPVMERCPRIGVG